MLGFHDFWIGLVYFLCIGSTILCVIYGILNWNRGGLEPSSPEKILKWEKDEDEFEDNI